MTEKGLEEVINILENVLGGEIINRREFETALKILNDKGYEITKKQKRHTCEDTRDIDHVCEACEESFAKDTPSYVKSVTEIEKEKGK